MTTSAAAAGHHDSAVRNRPVQDRHIELIRLAHDQVRFRHMRRQDDRVNAGVTVTSPATAARAGNRSAPSARRYCLRRRSGEQRTGTRRLRMAAAKKIERDTAGRRRDMMARSSSPSGCERDMAASATKARWFATAAGRSPPTIDHGASTISRHRSRRTTRDGGVAATAPGEDGENRAKRDRRADDQRASEVSPRKIHCNSTLSRITTTMCAARSRCDVDQAPCGLDRSVGTPGCRSWNCVMVATS